MKVTELGEASVTDRMERLPGYDVERWRQATVAVVGVGAGSLAALGLVKKGVGHLILVDNDLVEVSNLSRQFYVGEQRFNEKAIALAANLEPHAIEATIIDAVPLTAQAAVLAGVLEECTHAVCIVDNDEARAFVAKYFLRRGVPVVFAAFNDQAEGGYTFIQRSNAGSPCFGCLSPSAIRDPKVAKCAAGATSDIVFVTAGLVGWAIDVLVGNRASAWVYKEISLSGNEWNDGVRGVPVRPDCPLCGTNEKG